jgi:hypothetical protein
MIIIGIFEVLKLETLTLILLPIALSIESERNSPGLP